MNKMGRKIPPLLSFIPRRWEEKEKGDNENLVIHLLKVVPRAVY